MAGVTVDSVIVEVTAKIAKYEADLDKSVKKTQDAFAKMRKAAAAPIVPQIADAQKAATAVEKAEEKKQKAAKKTAETEEQAQARIAAVIQRTIQRQNEQAANAEKNATRIQRAYNKTLASAQTRAMGGTSLGGGNIAPPKDAIDYSMRDRIDAETRYAAIRNSSDAKAKAALSDQITYLRLIDRYKKAGLSETQAAVRAEQRLAEIEKARSRIPSPGVGGRTAGANVASLGLAGRLLPAIGVGTAVAAAKQFLDIADASKQLEAQLKLATDGFGSFGQAQTDVKRISTATRADVESTAKLYANFTRNAKELGITQAEAARATETVAKAFTISGASTQEATQATRQLIQGLQSGTLRGDELNSVLESAPRLSKLLAQSLGVTVGELRKLAEEGKLTSKALVDAFTNQKFTAGLDREFDQLPVTVSQAMNLVSNAAIETFGAFDRGGRFSETIAEFIKDSAAGFASMADSAERLGIAIRSEFSGIAAVVGTVVGAIRGVVSYLDEAGVKVADINKQVYENIKRLIPAVELIERLRNSSTYKDAREKTERELKGEADERRFRLMVSGTDALGNPNIGTPGGARPTAAPVAQSAADRRKAEAAAKKAAREAEKAARDQAKDEQQERQAQIEVLRAKQNLTDNVEARADLELQMLAIEKAQRVADIENDRTLSAQERAARLKHIAELYGPVNTDPNAIVVGSGGLLQRGVNRDLQRQADSDASDLASALNEIEQAKLQDELDMATTRKDRARIQLELLNLELDEKKRALEQQQKTATSDAQKEAINAQIADIDRQRATGSAAIGRDNEGAIARRARELNNQDTQELAEQFVVDQLAEVQSGIASALQKAIGVKDPIIGQLLDMLIQDVLIKPIINAMNEAMKKNGGGLDFGSIATAIGSLFSGSPARASGGNVVAGQTYRVNETGIEGFRPAQSGTIIPLGRMNPANSRGGTTVIAPMQFDTRGLVATDTFAAQIMAMNRQYATAVAQAAGQAAFQAGPQRFSDYGRDGI